ncbi:MAG: amidohydrolase family protein [Verrucomicrobiota bacterium JB022]|nr:amidohydrolase family protein [Verrucomicrobiota bacterium JB022]
MAGYIDWHTHRYPTEVAQAPAQWAAEQGEHYWGLLVTRGPQGWADHETMVAAMDAGGVEKSVLQGWYWIHQRTCHWQNELFLEWARQDPEHFVPFATVQPAAGELAYEQLVWALDQGCKGIGEMMPTVQGFNVRTDATWLKICALAQERHVPITLHVTEPVGHDYPGRIETPLADYFWLAEQFPELPLVFAHWGGGLPFYFLNRHVRKVLHNVYFDTAASPLLYDRRVWQTVLGLVGPERILFGTDYPLRVYPRTEKEPSFAHLVQEAEAEITDLEARSLVMQGNARRLLGL